MKTVRGDLITLAKSGDFDVIIHGCNCLHVMGGGVALGIRMAFPEAYKADQATKQGDKSKLGTCSEAVCPIGDDEYVAVINAYTQFDFGQPGVHVDYEAVRSCMAWVKKTHHGELIGLPKIGAGLAGGDWAVISKIIDEELEGEDVTLVEYQR